MRSSSNKVDEADRANSDLRNLFESTRVATVFLDQHMVIRAYTPEAGNVYNLIPTDRGRPLTDIVSRVDYDALRADVLQVLTELNAARTACVTPRRNSTLPPAHPALSGTGQLNRGIADHFHRCHRDRAGRRASTSPGR